MAWAITEFFFFICGEVVDFVQNPSGFFIRFTVRGFDETEIINPAKSGQ